MDYDLTKRHNTDSKPHIQCYRLEMTGTSPDTGARHLDAATAGLATTSRLASSHSHKMSQRMAQSQRHIQDRITGFVNRDLGKHPHETLPFLCALALLSTDNITGEIPQPGKRAEPRIAPLILPVCPGRRRVAVRDGSGRRELLLLLGLHVAVLRTGGWRWLQVLENECGEVFNIDWIRFQWLRNC